MEKFYYAGAEQGLSSEEIRAALLETLEGRTLKHVLIIPPDFTRFHSNAGFITNVYYHALTELGCEVDILPALGTHVAVTREEVIAVARAVAVNTVYYLDGTGVGGEEFCDEED